MKKNVCFQQNTTQWPWRGALSRAWSSPRTFFSALFRCWTQALCGVGKGESRDLTIRAQSRPLCLLVEDSPILVFVHSVIVNPSAIFILLTIFFCCCFRVSYIWFRLGQFFPTGYSWGGKTFQSVQQVSGEGGRSIFLSYHCISKSTKLSNFRCFQRYLLLGTKEWTNLSFSEHALIAFLHSLVFSVSLVVVCLFSKSKATQNYCTCFTQLRAS